MKWGNSTDTDKAAAGASNTGGREATEWCTAAGRNDARVENVGVRADRAIADGAPHAATCFSDALQASKRLPKSRSGNSRSATRRRCARRDRGMPFDRQLWMVEEGVSVMRETAVVPPSASIR